MPSFGGASSVAAQESILFGISAFLNTHDIHAIVLSATNEEDAYFLSQFFHANNSGARIVVVGATRLFLRGSTAQFRGDLTVDDFPMLPKLNDWTSSVSGRGHVEQIFATGFAQGIYIATIDLLKAHPNSGDWFPEYSTPNFSPDHAKGSPTLRPPMYLTALGMDSPWPVDVLDAKPFKFPPASPTGAANSESQQTSPMSPPAKWKVELPFTLFQHDDPPLELPSPVAAPKTNAVVDKAAAPAALSVSQYWRVTFLAVWLQVALYCVCFIYAKPVARQLCASFEPAGGGRYWCFTVILPSLLIGIVFSLLDGPLATLSLVSREIFWWHIAASASSIVAPLLNAVLASFKAGHIPKQAMLAQSSEAPQSEPVCKEDRTPLASDPGWHGWKLASFVPALLFLLFCLVRSWLSSGAAPDLGIVLNAYREMHLRSGLSLLPTWLLLCLGFFCWVRQASIGSALLIDLPRLPAFPADICISRDRGESIGRDSRPLPTPERKSAILHSEIRWLYILWTIAVLLMVWIVLYQHSFEAITTLEPHAATMRLKFAMLAICALMLLDVFQFFWVWDRLRALLNALDARFFKRSFVPIEGFKWSGLWSFAGVSFSGQRAILTAQVDCVEELLREVEKMTKAGCGPLIGPKALEAANAVVQLRLCYRSKEMAGITSGRYREDLQSVHARFAEIGDALAPWMERPPQGEKAYPDPREFPLLADSFRKALTCQREEKHGPYVKEYDEVSRLLPWQQTAEKFLCLLYISFIQAIISRLHRLMVSIAALFSSFTVAVAIYPFAPMQPFLLGGVTFLIVLAVAFYLVFSQMDTNPVLSRIVNGDERKLAWSFYGKFAESIALPALTIISSLLPGGTGRVLEVLTKLVSHSQ